jgi:aspartyl-tRNA(Asn)/glutamyl-tRNA(Gln) amidotransferase subunit A
MTPSGDFRHANLLDLAARVRTREVSARELVTVALDRIDAVNGEINAFVAVDAEAALLEADRIDERFARGEDPGPLAGIPIGVKDLEDATGFVTTAGSLLHGDDAPAGADSVFVQRLRESGCVVVGKTNTPEMGCKSDTVNKLFGATVNPWGSGRSAGGSSGGSAAAVASGMVPLATASDGGGSIRIPAAICGLTGFKPSLGRVPAGGEDPPGWAELSSKGPLTRTAAETAAVLDCTIGPDPTDLRSLPLPDVAWHDAVVDPGVPRRVVWSPTLGFAPVDPEVRAVCEAAVRALEAAGTEVVEETSVFPVDPVRPWLVLTSASNLRSVGHLHGTPEWDRLDPVVQSSAEWARRLTAVQVVEAQDEAHLLNLTLVRLFHDATYLLTPTVAAQTPAPDGFGMLDDRPDPNWVRFTYPFNLTRSPAGTVCAGFTTDGMPVGLQLVGGQHADVSVLRGLALFERLLDIEAVAPML